MTVHHEFFADEKQCVLKMANDDDGFYIQEFRNWKEVEDFIAKMRAEAEKVFGKATFKAS